MRGVYAKRDIKSGESIVFVPYDALIEKNKVFRDTEIGILVDSIKDKLVGADALWYESVDMLAIMLLEQKSLKTDSHYFHFLNNFPAVDDFPLMYGEKERKLLFGSPFLTRLEKVEANYREDYNLLLGFVPELSKYSFEQFLESCLWASSRNFGVTVNETKTNVMVPLSDMFNHAETH
jgi:hypothetical protein